MINEDNYLMISGIQHFAFCKRQWALIHIEQQWEENVKTIEGHRVHQKTDDPFIREKRGDKLTVRSMPIRSDTLQIRGICDVVEFIHNSSGISLHGEEGTFLPYPVEYKRGKPKKHDADILQLTAQAICLEEMLACDVEIGYLFYHEVRQRIEIPITSAYREQLKQIVDEMQGYYQRGHTPKVKPGSFCRQCSLQNICLPEILSKRSVKSYIEAVLDQ